MDTLIFDDDNERLRYEYDSTNGKAIITSGVTGSYLEEDVCCFHDALAFFTKAKDTRNDWEGSMDEYGLY